MNLLSNLHSIKLIIFINLNFYDYQKLKQKNHVMELADNQEFPYALKRCLKYAQRTKRIYEII